MGSVLDAVEAAIARQREWQRALSKSLAPCGHSDAARTPLAPATAQADAIPEHLQRLISVLTTAPEPPRAPPQSTTPPLCTAHAAAGADDDEEAALCPGPAARTSAPPPEAEQQCAKCGEARRASAGMLGDSEARLRAEMVAHVVLTVACLVFVYANVALAVVAPVFSFLVVSRKEDYKHVVSPHLFNAVGFLGALAAMLGVLDFSTAFWDGPGYTNWAKVFVPATYPPILLYLALAAFVFAKMLRKLKEARVTSGLCRVAEEARHYAVSESGELSPAPLEGSCVSVYTNPGFDTRLGIVSTFGVTYEAVQRCLDPHEPVGLSLRPSHTLLVLKFPSGAAGAGAVPEFRPETVGVFVLPGRLLVVARTPLPLLERRRVRGGRGVGLDAWDVAVQLIAESVALYARHLAGLSATVDDIERCFADSVDNERLLELFEAEKSMAYLLTATASNGRLLASLSGGELLSLQPRQHARLNQLFADNRHVVKGARLLSDSIAGLMDSRAAVIGNNLNYMMVDMNGLVIGIAIPAFLGALAGMSEFSAWLGPRGEQKAVGFTVFSMVSVVICVGSFIVIRKTLRWWHF
eukprot:m51a1_g5187 hypothetical protein (580) ;mRNA; f:189739-191689